MNKIEYCGPSFKFKRKRLLRALKEGMKYYEPDDLINCYKSSPYMCNALSMAWVKGDISKSEEKIAIKYINEITRPYSTLGVKMASLNMTVNKETKKGFYEQWIYELEKSL